MTTTGVNETMIPSDSNRHECGQCDFLLENIDGQRFFCGRFADDGQAQKLRVLEQRDAIGTTLIPIACQQCPGWGGEPVKEREIEVTLGNTMCVGELEDEYKLSNVQADALHRLLYSVGLRIIFDEHSARIAGLSVEDKSVSFPSRTV
jgi:hypothetical protein